MTQDKQIEEMAKATMKRCEIDNQCGSCHWSTCNECLAEVLINAGYRKASEVAREIIADLVKFADDKERQMSFHGHSVWYIDADDVTDFIAELKKKYTEGKE